MVADIRMVRWDELALPPGVRYEFRARSVDLWGRRSEWSTRRVVLAVAPGPVRNVRFTATDSSLVVTADPPLWNGGLPLSR